MLYCKYEKKPVHVFWSNEVMKNHLFCVGIEFQKGFEKTATSYAYLTVYLGADDIQEAIERVEKHFEQQGNKVLFVRGCWVVDADCDDGFCPTDESNTAIEEDLLFNNQIHYGKLQEWSINDNYEY